MVSCAHLKTEGVHNFHNVFLECDYNFKGQSTFSHCCHLKIMVLTLNREALSRVTTQNGLKVRTLKIKFTKLCLFIDVSCVLLCLRFKPLYLTVHCGHFAIICLEFLSRGKQYHQKMSVYLIIGGFVWVMPRPALSLMFEERLHILRRPARLDLMPELVTELGHGALHTHSTRLMQLADHGSCMPRKDMA